MDVAAITAPSPPAASIAAACARAAALARPVLLCVARPLTDAPDPLSLVAAARRAGATAALLERRGDGVALAALGAAWARDAAGPERFATLRAAAAALFAEAVVDGETAPLAIAAFAFAATPPAGDWSGFPAGRAVVPRLALRDDAGRTTLLLNVLVAPGETPEVVARRLRRALARLHDWRAARPDDSGSPSYQARPTPEPAAWKRAVAATTADIAAGRVAKLVLARTCRLEAAAPFACGGAVARLRQAYPTCTTFWLGGAAGFVVGATPETLVRVRGRTAETAALAGTIARATGAADDEALAEALLASDKDRREHAIVVDALAGALRPVCDELTIDEVPRVVRLANVHHLRSAIRGHLATRTHVLDLVARLHPTPAVAGHPRAAALAALPDREGLERGWYAGPIGWFDAAGDGAFDVALRCALVRERRAVLYAGAGIVAGSDPDAELAETRLKLQPLLAALMEV